MMSAPNTMSGRSRRTCSVNAIASRARVAALHALEDQVVAVLEREMQMRHQPRLVRDRVEQVGVGLDRVDRGDAQAFEFRHVPQDLPHQLAEPRRAGQA